MKNSKNRHSSIFHTQSRPFSGVTELRVGLLLVTVLLAACIIGCSNSEEVELSPIEQLDKAEALVRILDFENARKLLVEARPAFVAGKADWSRATYLLSVSNRFLKPVLRTRMEEVESLLEDLYRKAEDQEIRSQAALDLGRVHELADFPGDVTDLEKAREWYSRAKAIAPNSDMMARSHLRLAHTYAKELDESSVRQAVTLLESFVEEFPDSQWTSVALQYLGDLYAFWFEDTATALSCYEKAFQRGFSLDSLADRYIWRMIVWAEENGQYEQVIEYAQALIEGYPRSTYQTLANDKLEAARAAIHSGEAKSS